MHRAFGEKIKIKDLNKVGIAALHAGPHGRAFGREYRGERLN